MGRESSVNDGDWLVALDLMSTASGSSEAIVRMAARVEPDWIVATSKGLEHRLDESQGTVKAFEVDRYDALVLKEHPVAPDPAVSVTVSNPSFAVPVPTPLSAAVVKM